MASDPGQDESPAPSRPGGRPRARTPWVVGVLTFVTLGVYVPFWWYAINRELDDFGRSRREPLLECHPGVAAAAIAIGPLLVAANIGGAVLLSTSIFESASAGYYALWLVAVVLITVLMVPTLFTLAATFQRGVRAQLIAGTGPELRFNPWVYTTFLLLFAPLAFAYPQAGLNLVWNRPPDA